MAEKRKNKHSKSCSNCGADDFTWGKLNAGGSPVFFTPEGFFKNGKQMKARQCNQCGGVQFFAEKPT